MHIPSRGQITHCEHPEVTQCKCRDATGDKDLSTEDTWGAGKVGRDKDGRWGRRRGRGEDDSEEVGLATKGDVDGATCVYVNEGR